MSLEHREGRLFSNIDQCEIYWQQWRPIDREVQAVIGLVHGFCEHSGRYRSLVEALVPYGFVIHALDHRGHGHSGGERGHVHRFDHYRWDLHQWIRQTIDPEKGALPFFLIGHSMGGLITLDYALHHPNRLRGIVVSGPMLRLRLKVPAVKVLAGRLLSRVAPRFTLPNELDSRMLSHDPKVVKAREEDPLIKDVASSRWFTESMKASQQILQSASRLQVPALLMHGGDDPLTDPKATQEFFEALPISDKKWVEWPGMYHEIFNEIDRDQVFEVVRVWLENHLSPNHPK